MIHIINIHYWWLKHSLCILGIHFLKKNCRFFTKIFETITNKSPITPVCAKRVISRLHYSESLWKMLQIELCLHFCPWGFTEIFWDKIILFYWKITENWKNPSIIILFSPLSLILVNLLMVDAIVSYIWCHKHGFRILLVIWGQKRNFFFQKSVKLLPVNSSLLNYQ
jgi:hypothetical protein